MHDRHTYVYIILSSILKKYIAEGMDNISMLQKMLRRRHKQI